MGQKVSGNTLDQHIAPVMAQEKSFELTEAMAESIAEYAAGQRPEWNADQLAAILMDNSRCWTDADRTVAAAGYIINDESITDFSVIAKKGPWWAAFPKKV